MLFKLQVVKDQRKKSLKNNSRWGGGNLTYKEQM